MSKYQELWGNPPKLNVEGDPREVKINLISCMCDNKYRWTIYKNDGGDYKINTHGFAYSNWQIKYLNIDKMIKNKNEKPKGPIEIDLTGPDGNAFALMGYAKKFSKQLGLDSEEIISNMMSGDYENLLDVMEENFGDFIVMYR